MDSSCIFCKIVAGEIPSTRVYEDDRTLAFMDIAPFVKGHTLVIPKAHHEQIGSTPLETLHAIIAVVKRVAAAQTDGLGADGVKIAQANGGAAGQVVPHIHFHVIPRFADDGRPTGWASESYASTEEMTELGAKLRAAMPQP